MTLETARSILAELQRRVDARDLDLLVDYFTEDGILIGTSAHNIGPEAVRRYLAAVVAQERLCWDFREVVAFHEGAGELGIAAFGHVEYTDEAGEHRDPFRLTVLAIETDVGWRLRMFHGSIPAT